jgi:hypothetical protein
MGIVATPPRGEPAFRPGQLSTAGLNLVCGKVLVDGLVTTVCWVLGHGAFLGKVMILAQGSHGFSMLWHT